MIKKTKYGKLLKQGFFTLLISCFILLGNSFVNAFDLSENLYIRENGNYGFSPYDNAYDLQVIDKGNLLTQKVGLTLRGIYLRDGTYMVWKYSDYLGGNAPFLSYKGTGNSVAAKVVNQGFPTHYAICDYFTGNSIADYNLTGCSVSELNPSSLNTIASFMGGVSSTDNFGFNYKYSFQTDTYRNAGVLFCFSSEFYNRSMCFGITRYINGHDYIYPGFRTSESNSYLFSGYGVALPASFDSLYSSNLSMSPGKGNNTNSNITNVGSCPTIGQLMQNMGENYNTGLCYNNTTYFNGTNFEQVEKQDIFTIYNNDYQEYTNRISIYRNNCTYANTTQACQNAFSGEYKKYSIISNAINSNVDEKKLRNYCNYGLNYDPNTTTCVASGGGIKEPYTNEEIIEETVNNGTIPTPNQTTGENNNVLNALNKCENGDRECYVNDRNFIESLENIYRKINGLFKERKGVNGIIPNYILRMTFIAILFTVIFKK